MAKWDILHVKSLEVERAVPEQKLLEDIKEGRLSRDDCVRKPGDDRWWRIYEVQQFRAPSQEGADEPPRLDEGSIRSLLAEAEPPQAIAKPIRRVVPAAIVAGTAGGAGTPGLPTVETPIAAVLDEPDEGLPYTKRRHEQQEELDMTPMVDVAMQLILFFMVTSSMIMQMCLQFPHPAPDSDRPTVQEKVQKLDDLKTDHIIVKVKADNSILVDEDRTKESDLTSKFESIMHARNPNGGVVIQADEQAFHETVVAVVDAANLAKITSIKMANPQKQAKKAATKKRAIK
jgi:biopolymer transport protein ExbD